MNYRTDFNIGLSFEKLRAGNGCCWG